MSQYDTPMISVYTAGASDGAFPSSLGEDFSWGELVSVGGEIGGGLEPVLMSLAVKFYHERNSNYYYFYLC